jgi:hypothetical protein
MSRKPRAVRQIPADVTSVDLTTGKETPQGGSWKVMPPSADKCQICAAKHAPHQPHNAQSIYYQMTFQGMLGRAPTWADAVAHCSDQMKLLWEKELRIAGAWSEPPQGEQPVKHHGV